MAKAAMLFNGIQLPYDVVDRAFAWATQSNSSLIGVFLKAGKLQSEGYIFPSDLDAAENLTSDKDSQDNQEMIINSNIRILEHRAAGENIELRSVLLTNPTEASLLEEIKGCECIFVSDKITEQGMMTVDNLNLKNWLTNPPVPVELIRYKS
jgi:hypothetical protein